MNGLPNYSTFDGSRNNSPANLGHGRSSTVGTLIHTTSGLDSFTWLTTGSAASGNPASCDVLIGRLGQRYTLCPPGQYPYHAGQSSLTYNNRVYHGNEVSQLLMGVELECLDSERVTWQQVDSLAELIVSDPLARGWRWPYYLLGHYEVALPVGRRSDPMGLDWGALMGRLYVRARAAGISGL